MAWWTWLLVGGLVVLLLSGGRRCRAEVKLRLIVQTALAALVFNSYLTLGLAPSFLHYQAGSEAAFYCNRYYPGVPVVQVHHASSVALAVYLAQPLRTMTSVAETATLRHRPYLLYAPVAELQGVPGHLVHTFANFPVSRPTLPFLYYHTRSQVTQTYGLLLLP
jgi:hypothetical protein